MTDERETSLLDSRNRDPLAIAVAVLSILVQLGMWFYWGGKIETRVSALEENGRADKVYRDAALQKDATHDSQLAVVTTQYAEVIRRLGNIESKLEERRR